MKISNPDQVSPPQFLQEQFSRAIRSSFLVTRWSERVLPLIAVLLCLPTTVSAGTIRVGSGAGCDASTIQQGVALAMSQPGSDIVQVSHLQTFTGNVSINGAISTDVIVIDGGFDGCTDSQVQVYSILEGSSSASAALTITQGVDVRVFNMLIRNSGGNALTVSSAGTRALIRNSILSDSSRGASVQTGAYLEIGDTTLVIDNNNDSFFGGGLYCTGVGSRLDVAGIVENNSSSLGGGIHASDSCDLKLFDASVPFNEALIRGGGIFVDDGADLTIATSPVSNIHNNSAEYGGGIYVTGAGSTLDVNFTNIDDNEADFGGGIYASTLTNLTLRGSVKVRHNSATDGGGIAAGGNTIVALKDGFRAEFNDATNGGGFYLASGAQLSGAADGLLGIGISDNEATRGGGLYITGGTTDAVLYNYAVVRNEAQVAGGGVFVTNGAYFEMNRGNSIPCAEPPRCSQLSENSLSQGTDGSALLLEDGAGVRLYQTYIDGNRHLIPGANSQVVHARGTDTALRLEGARMWANDASTLISSDDSAGIVAGFVTAAENLWSLDGSTTLPKAATTTNGGTILLASSILVDTDGYSGAVSNDCLIIDNAAGLVANGTTAVGIDPQLVDPLNGDLHLQGSSPAIDYCNGTVFSPEDPLDLDLDARGVDHPEVAGLFGLYDLGMDETLASTALFIDGFESGNTTAWQ